MADLGKGRHGSWVVLREGGKGGGANGTYTPHIRTPVRSRPNSPPSIHLDKEKTKGAKRGRGGVPLCLYWFSSSYTLSFFSSLVVGLLYSFVFFLVFMLVCCFVSVKTMTQRPQDLVNRLRPDFGSLLSVVISFPTGVLGKGGVGGGGLFAQDTKRNKGEGGGEKKQTYLPWHVLLHLYKVLSGQEGGRKEDGGGWHLYWGGFIPVGECGLLDCVFVRINVEGRGLGWEWCVFVLLVLLAFVCLLLFERGCGNESV